MHHIWWEKLLLTICKLSCPYYNERLDLGILAMLFVTICNLYVVS